ncbi:hypothetical protein ACR79M_04405 [Sphingobacterium spiritivorum]|uniref:hypothetical protein n=1 Tax=Sphingobacterium TaxID=28453 RepID=UPI0025E8C28F|nr:MULTISPECIES: hypothetical protein [unclassified Sphingobacterium]
MKNLLFTLCTLLLVLSCKKEEVYSPWKLKNGQIVELQVSHKYGSTDNQLLLLPGKESIDISLYDFNEREPGYNYKVKAKMVGLKEPPMDGSSYYFEFMKVLNKEKYNGTETFTIPLIRSAMPGGPYILIRKKEGKYYFEGEKLILKPLNTEAAAELEMLWQEQMDLEAKWKANQNAVPKWHMVTARVKHDPDNFGKAYIVEKLTFTTL